MKKLLAITAVALTFACSSHAAVIFENVVFGNLGAGGVGVPPDGASAVNNTITSNSLIAQGFSTGTSSLLSLKSIDLWIDATTGSGNYSLSLYSDTAGLPGTLFATSSAKNISHTGSGQFVQFQFSGLALSASTQYWAVAPTGTQWYTAASFAAPTVQNASGYVAPGYTLQNLNNAGWTTTGLNSYSLAVEATGGSPVPEPGTWAMAAALFALATGVHIQRRRKAANVA